MNGVSRKLNRFGEGVGRHSDLALVGLSIVVIALMVLPIPFLLLDIMVALNIALSIAMLLYSIYMASPVAFSTFPSVLLITTLLRIALNVATTRQILLNANAGEIIASFGRLVVGGSLIVGLVVFTIITIIQFIVIAKGAERVAEVIARFTLDAIPGKQMSIDSDLRSGLISEQIARQRRAEVEQESLFFGSMDGAMKFVKGDAIAGIIAVLVNLIGGIAIGVMIKGHDIGTAAELYSVLTIGEGLAAQIPALFISMAAGLIVTRTSSSQAGSLAGSITTQVLSQPRALMLTGAVVALFALVPGFPALTFLALGGTISALGAMLTLRRRRAVEGAGTGIVSMAREGSGELHPIVDESVPPVFSALLFEIPRAVLPLLSREELDTALTRLRRDLSLNLGLPFPGVRIRIDETLPALRYNISVLEVRAVGGTLCADAVLAFASRERLASLGVAPIDAPPVFLGAGAHWVAAQGAKLLRQHGVATWSASRLLVAHLETVVTLHAHRLLGMQDAQSLVTACAREYPDLVREAIKVVPLPRLTRMLRSLCAEGVSLRNMRDILQVALENGAAEKNDEIIVERIRAALGRSISSRYIRESGDAMHGKQDKGGASLDAYLMDPGAEERIRASLTMSGNGLVAALAPPEARALVDSVRRAVQQQRQGGQREPLPLVVAADIRRPLRKLIELELPWLPVLSFAEVDAGVDITPLSMIHA
ncbi:flagellar biosynthesis protein FlhA [Pseudoduganella lutea]|uniref:EscV/YscV/HrcV family type III secretion system export apparatus protein n=1 Tax=Pseudoduganella lutea TaxID=321985 RepID=A0A4P6KT85_9BURK|nr:flagellar biosynthesis protein FlhA [Pseudoduganella lutea]QBE61946.1 EscV/YscV/HrcV family type III secretion system export apparatus protein [Pseudoduganella lutea]